jgi:tetratricopeptide (TPR) repeat protein
MEIVPRAESVADQICQLCGCLPLAIRAAGSLLATTADLDPSDYVMQLKDERSRLERIGTEGVEIGVEASFNLSYARLEPDAARVFRQLVAFPFTFDGTAEEAVCADPGHSHLSELVRRSLVHYDITTNRYRLHDLARVFAGARLSDDERDAGQRRHAEHFKEVLAAADELYLKGGDAIAEGLGLFDLEWANIRVGQEWATALAGTDDERAQLSIDYSNAGVYVLSLRQHPRESIKWLEVSLAAARRLKKRAHEGTVLGNLGVAYMHLGETKRAIEVYEQALLIDREVGDRKGEGRDLGNLGIVNATLGKTNRAIELYEQQLVVTREIGDKRGESNALGNLGLANASLGKTKRAIELYEQALIIDREIGDRKGEGADLGNLGVAYRQLGETRRAIELYEQRLVIAREIGDRLGEGIVNFNMSLARDELGEQELAIVHAEQALTIFDEIEHPNAEGVRSQLALWCEEKRLE